MTTNYLTPADAEMAFYDALERNDLEDMMAVWLDNDAVVCVHPGASRLEGVADIRSGFEHMFDEPTPAMDFTLSELRCHRVANLSIHNLREEIEIDGQVISVMLATNIYQQTASGWRLLLHHASPELDFELDDMDLTLDGTVPIVLH